MTQQKMPLRAESEGQTKNVNAMADSGNSTGIPTILQEGGLTLPGSFGILRVEPKNSSWKVRQHLKRGLFFCVRTLEKYGVFSVTSGREWANRIPCKGEYARRSKTVLSSRPFLRPAIGQLRKSWRFPMFKSFLRSTLINVLTLLLGAVAAFAAMLPVVKIVRFFGGAHE